MGFLRLLTWPWLYPTIAKLLADIYYLLQLSDIANNGSTKTMPNTIGSDPIYLFQMLFIKVSKNTALKAKNIVLRV